MVDFILPPKNTASAFAAMRGHHVAIRVTDFEIAKRWYVEKLDFRVIHEWPFADEQLAYLAPANDDHFMVEILGGGDPLPIDPPAYTDLGDSLRYSGYHHFCINVTDIEATVAELRARGVNIVTEPFKLDDISRKLAFFADPFGNLIELAEVVA
ncbi:VOC family protein [Neorhizobium galegae]|uniref:VOC family protein n=1 Tax=Neorhizobium galegae TaxID=399 RepID=UPI000622A8C0|nr:VOC family protein [Neorhizobium galegae]KAB1124262.1 VOC family protein [Neorhizobium galegae]MCQ1809629.1 VOC family protein [Neorhizobium galegae]CDZ57441.1 Glyoxalase family protein [Neorhizobium galegae bv. orientalis]